MNDDEVRVVILDLIVTELLRNIFLSQIDTIKKVIKERYNVTEPNRKLFNLSLDSIMRVCVKETVRVCKDILIDYIDTCPGNITEEELLITLPRVENMFEGEEAKQLFLETFLK